MKRKAKFLAIFGVMSLAAWAGVLTGLAEETNSAAVDAVGSDNTEQTQAAATEAATTEATTTVTTEAATTEAATTEAATTEATTTEAATTEADTSGSSSSNSASESETAATEVSSEVITEPTTEPESQSETTAATESETVNNTDTTATETEKSTKKKKKETEKIDEKAAEDYENATGESIYVFGSYPAGNITDNTNEIYDYLRDVLGLNHAAACGVLANVQCESNFNSTAVGDGGTSYGICQWHLGRFSQLISWCNANGYDYHSIQGQMGYLTCELQGGYAGVYQYLLSVPDTADGAYAAADYWCRYFEIPANVDYQAAMRADLAVHEYYPETLGTQEETEEEVDVVSEEQLEAVVEQASDQLSSLSRLSVTTEETVETEETEAVSDGSMTRSELEETTQEAIAQALEEYEARQQEETEQQELDVDAIVFDLAQLSTVFAEN